MIPNTRVAKEVREALKEKEDQYDLGLLSSVLSSRVAFKEAVSSGLSVVEKDSISKASKEMMAFFNEINI